MISTSDFSSGIIFEQDGVLYEIIDFQHVKRGRGASYMWARLKNLKSGSQMERTFSSGEVFQDVSLEEKKLKFIYEQGGDYVFMDARSFEQLELHGNQIQDIKNYLKEDIEFIAKFHNEEMLLIKAPIFVELLVTYTEPGVRGDTATNVTKPATLETGYVANVPLFIEQGEVIRIDTRSGSYVERAR